MRRTQNTSFSPSRRGSRETGRLVWLPLERLRPHPANPNRMAEEQLRKLTANIARERDHPPIVARPDPQEEGAFQVLDGLQRWEVLQRLGHKEALCYIWPCDDATALVLLGTLNRLVGTDEPLKRAELLHELAEFIPMEELAALLPEDAAAIRQHLELLESDLETLLAAFEHPPSSEDGLRAITFVVTTEDEAAIEEAVAFVRGRLEGNNRRGRALAEISRSYLAGRRESAK